VLAEFGPVVTRCAPLPQEKKKDADSPPQFETIGPPIVSNGLFEK
jgi:hypothetical protein